LAPTTSSSSGDVNAGLRVAEPLKRRHQEFTREMGGLALATV
jgi:hypothetical protein